MNDESDSRTPRGNGADPNHSVTGTLRDLVSRITGGGRNGEASVRETLEELIEDRADAESPIVEEEKELLANILGLRDRTIEDVMVPRADITAVSLATSYDELVEVMTRGGHSRIPVFRDTLDDAIGMVHIKDVLAAGKGGEGFNLAGLVRKVLFVAPSMHALELLLEMRVRRMHMALVVDEYGGVDGLVTIEDLVEEIVGEIEDEHDTEIEPDLTFRPDGSLEADARASVDAFETIIGNKVFSEEEREDADTLGGLVFLLAGRVPIRGELVRHSSGLEIEVLDADPRRVKRVRIHGVTKPDQGAA
jgi:magnesium and cobalt transporter